MKRILAALKTYRQQTADRQDPICNRQVNAYFKKQLTIEDWIFWQRIQVEALIDRPDARSKHTACLGQMEQLMGHYKPAGQELIQLWRQNMPLQKEQLYR